MLREQIDELKQKYNKHRGTISYRKIGDKIVYHYDLIDDESDRHYPCGLKYKETTSSFGYETSRFVFVWINLDYFFNFAKFVYHPNSDQELEIKPCKKCFFTSFDKVDEQFFKDILFHIRKRPEPVRQFMREYMKHRFGDKIE